MKTKSIWLLIVSSLILFISIYGCQKTPAVNPPIDDEPAEQTDDSSHGEDNPFIIEENTVYGLISAIDTNQNTLSVFPSLYQSDAAKLFAFKDGELDDYGTGDTIKLNYETDGHTNRLVTIEHTDLLFRKEMTFTDLIPFETEKIIISYDEWDDAKGYVPVEIVIDDAVKVKSLIDQLKEIKVYPDGVMIHGIGYGVQFTFSNGNQELTVFEASVLRFVSDGKASYYSYSPDEINSCHLMQIRDSLIQ